jgi:VWFA-related protein
MRTLRFLLLTLLATAPAYGQYIESIEVSLANLDVVVVDRSGKPVRGLTRDDFEIFEDGKKQAITNFAAYSTASTEVIPGRVAVEGRPDGRVAAPRKQRLFGVFIDLVDIDQGDRKAFFAALRSFLRREFHEGDLVTLLLWTSRVRELVPITDDLGAADLALAHLEGAHVTSEWQLLEEMLAQRIQDLGRSTASAGIPIDLEEEEAYENRRAGEERCAYSRRKAKSLERLVASLAAHDMKKVIVVASDDLTMHPARGCPLLNEMEDIVTAANAYGVTLHAFHPPGIRRRQSTVQVTGLPAAGAPAPGAREDGRTFHETEGLSFLAAGTGGMFAIGTPSITQVLPDVAARLDNYYSLAYRMPAGSIDAPRKVRVLTRDRSYKVLARQSVVMLSEETQLRDAMTANLYADVPGGGALPVKVEITSTRRDDRNLRMMMRVTAPLRAMTVLRNASGNDDGTFSVWVTSGSELGDAAAVSRQETRFSFPAGAASTDETIEYTFELVVRRGTRRVAVALRDETTKEYGLSILAVPRV